MRKFVQNKLWRDKAPGLMREHGSIIHTVKLNDNEYEQQLKIKLKEELEEICVAQSQEELKEELADLFEVIDALCAISEISLDEIKFIQQKKREKRGGFYERAFVTIAEHPENSFGEQYCLNQPDKYPEISV